MAVPVVLDADALGPVPQPSLIELAARGEPEALTEIKNKEPSSREPVEVAALFDGEEARSREKASKAVLALAKKRSFTPEDEAEFFRHVGDARTFREALVAMATNESEAGPDLIYSTARRFRLQRDVHDFAMALLMTPSVSQYASPALSVIIDAETTTSCRDAKKLVDRVYEDGDVRAVRHMAKFAETVGCGKMGNEDCYPCLRDDRALVDALRAAHARSAPH